MCLAFGFLVVMFKAISPNFVYPLELTLPVSCPQRGLRLIYKQISIGRSLSFCFFFALHVLFRVLCHDRWIQLAFKIATQTARLENGIVNSLQLKLNCEGTWLCGDSGTNYCRSSLSCKPQKAIFEAISLVRVKSVFPIWCVMLVIDLFFFNTIYFITKTITRGFVSTWIAQKI